MANLQATSAGGQNTKATSFIVEAPEVLRYVGVLIEGLLFRDFSSPPADWSRTKKKSYKRCNDIQQNDTQHKDSQYNYSQQNGRHNEGNHHYKILLYDIQHNGRQHNDSQHSDGQQNDTEHNETQHNDRQQNGRQHKAFTSTRLGIRNDTYDITFSIMTLFKMTPNKLTPNKLTPSKMTLSTMANFRQSASLILSARFSYVMLNLAT